MFRFLKSHFPDLLSISPTETAQRLPRRQTQYLRMLMEYDCLPLGSNLFSTFFTWVLLAGYLVFPGTFTSIQKSSYGSDNRAQKLLNHAIQNLPLLWTAAFCCGVGACGIVWLWWKLRHNYLYLTNHLFM